MKYAFIQAHQERFALQRLCRVLGVSRSGYYAWRCRSPSARSLDNRRLDSAIEHLYQAHRGAYGAPRIHQELRAQGCVVSRKRVAKRLQGLGLRARAARKFKATTRCAPDLPVAENLLQQDFSAKRANEKWVSDITYLWTQEGWLYLAVVLDVFSRAVIGWSMGQRLTRDLVCQALSMALGRRQCPPGVVVHSDRGSQYASHEYQRLLRAHGLVCSMSKKGDCYDNAMMESFFGSLKVERVFGTHYATRHQAKQDVFEYIEIYYNRQRRHSALNYLSPAQFEAEQYAT